MSWKFKCPHCGKDTRSFDEIVTTINDFLDDFKEDKAGEFDLPFFKDSINAALELGDVKSRPVQSDRLNAVKKIIDDVSFALRKGEVLGVGRGHSKKLAEQRAAIVALERLGDQ